MGKDTDNCFNVRMELIFNYVLSNQRKNICFLLVLITLVQSFGFSQVQSLPNNYKFLALGDSYTIGTSVSSNSRWPSQLVDSLDVKGVINDTLIYIAQAGWRTDQLLQNASSANLANDFDLVSLLIGVNNQFQGRNIADYKRDLLLILSFAKDKAKGFYSNVLVLSIPDYAYTPFGQASIYPALISTEIGSFNAVKKKVCDSLGVTRINITGISRMGLLNPSLVANDGLHLSGEQYSYWVDKLLDELTGIFQNESRFKTNLFYPNPVNSNIRFLESVRSWRVLDMQTNEVYNSDFGENLELMKPGIYLIEMTLKSNEIRVNKISIN